MANSSGRKGQNGRLSKKELRQKRKIERTVGLALTAMLVIFMAVFMGLLMYLNVLPTLYVVAIVVVLLLILMYVFLSQFTKNAHMIGKVVAVVLSIIMAVGCYFLAVTNGVLSSITKPDAEVDVMSIVVLASDSAQSIEDTANYTYGINSSFSEELTKEAIDHVNADCKTTVATVDYENWSRLVEALYAGDVQAIIFNEGFRTTMDENYVSFSTDTKVLGTKEIEDKTPEIVVPEKEITNESFIVLLSGTDTEGKVSSTGRSDSNILAVVNPTERTIFLLTTPRDLWVPFYMTDGTNSGSQRDKLTHASNKGMGCLMSTLEALYDIDVDFYVRLNFTGMMKLVDALGGIDVYSDYAFTSYAQTHTYVKGMNHMDGYAALIYARERHAFSDGDFQRSKNQVAVIQAIADKALSVKLLQNYTGIMDSLQNFVTTNIPQDQLSKLVKAQLEDMSKGWTFKSYSINGVTGSEYCYTTGDHRSVVYVDDNQVAIAKAKIQAAMEGKDPDSVTAPSAQ